MLGLTERPELTAMPNQQGFEFANLCVFHKASKNTSRSPSSALFLFFGRVPLLKWTAEKKGTLILSSLLEDLDLVTFCQLFVSVDLLFYVIFLSAFTGKALQTGPCWVQSWARRGWVPRYL